MKYLFIYLYIIVSFTDCKAQKKNNMKTFDIESFNKHKDHLNNYSFKNNNGDLIQQDRWQFGFEEIVTKKENLISTYYKFYENGQLKLQGDFYPNDFEKGIWKEYDEQGNLIEETDYDAPYKFTWEDILKLIEKRGIDMTHENFEIGRNIVDNRPVWGIIYGKEESDKLGIIGIYGDTGEIFQESEKDGSEGGSYDDED
ncbi:hypothetical protein [Aquimarina agarivorans]|uniref:hypothetical protein n=1 Tax=Aquimarina agarivorans TaxID=980584 RepID=UPI000248F5F1|nr:hypothetical protein [Aquimarina agarivorans]